MSMRRLIRWMVALPVSLRSQAIANRYYGSASDALTWSPCPDGLGGGAGHERAAVAAATIVDARSTRLMRGDERGRRFYRPATTASRPGQTQTPSTTTAGCDVARRGCVIWGS